MHRYTHKELLEGRYGIEDFADAFREFYGTHELRHVAQVSFNVSLIAMQGVVAHWYQTPPISEGEAELYEIANYLVQAEPFLTGWDGRPSSLALSEAMWGVVKK